MSPRDAARTVLLLAVAAAAGWGAWRWLFPDDDARIRAALIDAASRVSTSVGEPAMARAARLPGLREALTPDIVVRGPGGLRLEGADGLLGAAAARLAGAGDVQVRLTGLEVVRDPGSRGAEVHGGVEVSGNGEHDAREVVFAMRQGDDGGWRIAGVTLVDPLERPAPAR